jgi:hypothetical protein
MLSFTAHALMLTVLAAAPAKDAALDNGLVRVAVDAQARLVELKDCRSGVNYAGAQPVWRMFYRQNEVLDIEACAPPAAPTITADAQSLVIRYPSLVTKDGKPLKIALELRAKIASASDDVTWSARIDNRQPGITITELQFPLVGNVQLQPGQSLIWSSLGGQRFRDPKATVRSRHSQYMAPDQNGVKMGALYPGAAAAMNCFAFAGERHGLYLGSHDPSLQTTLHLLRLVGDELQAGFVKYPFVTSGGTWASAEFVLAPYAGNWHVAAKKYRAWANSWFVPPQQPDWVRRMTGWQRIILKHQYGEVLHPYNTISQMARDGRSAGVNTMLIFGWWQAGMDGGYPTYEFDPALGGRDELVRQIQAARREGTKVHLYFNGRLIDKESEFYRSGEGQRISIKDLRGNEWNESYHFSGNGTTAWQLGRKTFVVACPASPEWQRIRLACVDQALDVGVDCVFFDQLGINEAPCTDPRHGHAVPLVSPAQIQSQYLQEIRRHVKARNPQTAFGTEIPCDAVAMHADFVHGLTGGTSPIGFLEWFRYTFPDVVISDREIRDDNDIERRVNLNLLRGLRSDVELYRCRGTIADAPHYREYLGRANALRCKYGDLFLEGTYCDTDYVQKSNAVVDARSFVRGKRLAVILTQSQRPEAATRLQVPGYRYLSGDGLGQYQIAPAEGGLTVKLAKHALAVALYEKE